MPKDTISFDEKLSTRKFRSFQAIENNDNTRKHPLQYLMQANENEQSFLEFSNARYAKDFQFHNANKNANIFFRCSRANSALKDMKNKPTN